MNYNSPTEIKFFYNGKEVKFHIYGEVGVNLDITCSHPIFKRTHGTFALQCYTSYDTILMPAFEHPDYMFFHFMSQALIGRLHYDFDKATGWL
jgi:hypothetical protein